MHLHLEAIDQSYGSAEVLRAIGFAVGEGECLAVLGRNGAGKTTLLQTLLGILPSRAGRIVFRGEDITRAPPHRRARLGMGYVPQGREIFSDLTVRQNLEIVMAANRIGANERRRLLDEVVGHFPVLGEMSGRRGGDLSGGQQQQLAFARALCTGPSLLVLDEPTEGIQPTIVQAIEEVIRSLKGRLAILLVEQRYDFARSLADDYLVIDRGRIVAEGRGVDMEADDVERHLSV